MPTNPGERSYTIQNNTHYFYTGRLSSGHQVLMGIQMPELIMVEFDAVGNYLNLIVKAPIHDPQVLSLGSAALIYDILPPELIQWQREIGFAPATISVKKFFLEDQWIGIQDLPDHFQEVLDNPDDYDEEERKDADEEILRWKEEGTFVLKWCEEYWLSRDGDVESS